MGAFEYMSSSGVLEIRDVYVLINGDIHSGRLLLYHSKPQNNRIKFWRKVDMGGFNRDEIYLDYQEYPWFRKQVPDFQILGG